MVNVSDQPRKILCGMEIATCEPVESVEHMGTDEPRAQEEMETADQGVPGNLQDLYLWSCQGLTPNQQDQLRLLLWEYQDVFSEGGQDLGWTGTVQSANTPDDCPCPSAMRCSR